MAKKEKSVTVGGQSAPRSFMSKFGFNKFTALVFIAVFGGLGAYFIIASHADSLKAVYYLQSSDAKYTFYTTDPARATQEQAYGWKVLGSANYLNEAGSAPVPVYFVHQTGTANNYYSLSAASLPKGTSYTLPVVVFYSSTSAQTPYGYCRHKVGAYYFDSVCSTNPAPKVVAPTPAPTTGSTSTTPSATTTSPTTSAGHSPYGYLDFCGYVNGQTVIYGWASDPDAPKGSLPNVTINVNQYNLKAGVKNIGQSSATVPTNFTPTLVTGSTAPTDGLNYRDVAINTLIHKYHAGDPIPGQYGYRVAFKGLYKGGFYQPKGLGINVGVGANNALNVNTTTHPDGIATRPYFVNSFIPDACLAPLPAAGKLRIAPGAGIAPSAAPVVVTPKPLVTTPKPAPKPAAPEPSNHISMGQSITTNEILVSGDKHYVLKLEPNGNIIIANAVTHKGVWDSGTLGKHGVKLGMLTNGDLKLYDKAGKQVWHTGIHQGGNVAVLTNNGYLDVLHHTNGTDDKILWTSRTEVTNNRPQNTTVKAYSGNNDGCGGDATHYASNKYTHVGKNNYGANSVCKCESGPHAGNYYKYAGFISDASNNKNCNALASGPTIGGGTGATQSTGRHECNSRDTYNDGCYDNCGPNAQLHLYGGTGCVSLGSSGQTSGTGVSNRNCAYGGDQYCSSAPTSPTCISGALIYRRGVCGSRTGNATGSIPTIATCRTAVVTYRTIDGAFTKYRVLNGPCRFSSAVRTYNTGDIVAINR